MTYATTRTITATPELTSHGPEIRITVSNHAAIVSISDEYGNTATMDEKQARNAARQILDMTDELRQEQK